MATQAAGSTADLPPLIAFPLVDAYQCPRCLELVEVPKWARLAGAAKPVRIKGDPLNHYLWLEEQIEKHRTCPLASVPETWHDTRVWRMA